MKMNGILKEQTISIKLLRHTRQKKLAIILVGQIRKTSGFTSVRRNVFLNTFSIEFGKSNVLYV